MLNSTELEEKLKELISQPYEDTWFEFKTNVAAHHASITPERILEYIRNYGQVTKEEIDNLLLDKFPAILDKEQKKNKIKNLLYSLSKRNK